MLKSSFTPVCALWLMAVAAIPAEIRLHMAWILARRKIITMTPKTVNGCSGKFIDLLIDMTGFAVCDGMNADQGEASLAVQCENFLLILPTVGGMATLTINTELSAMNIGVAICAGSAHFCEFQALMTVAAIHQFVSAHQFKACLVMIEIHGIFHLLP